MLSLFQFETGKQIGADPSWIVALQAVGGAAGNMICVHNIVAASAVAGLVGKEGLVIRKTVYGFLYYALFAGSLGYAIVSWSSHKSIFNIGTLLVLSIWIAAIVLIWLSGRGTAASPASTSAEPESESPPEKPSDKKPSDKEPAETAVTREKPGAEKASLPRESPSQDPLPKSDLKQESAPVSKRIQPKPHKSEAEAESKSDDSENNPHKDS